MHILHNHITLGEVTVLMPRKEAEMVRDLLTEMLEKGSESLHVVAMRDTTGIAVTVNVQEGTGEPAEKVYGFEACSVRLEPVVNL